MQLLLAVSKSVIWNSSQAYLIAQTRKWQLFGICVSRAFCRYFAGAALSVAGVLLQAIMRNPLADAGIIGISSGAAFTKLFIVSFFPAYFFFSPIAAFIGGAIACLLVFALSWKSGLDPLKLILVGIAINAMFSGLTEAFISFGASSAGSITSNLTLKHGMM